MLNDGRAPVCMSVNSEYFTAFMLNQVLNFWAKRKRLTGPHEFCFNPFFVYFNQRGISGDFNQVFGIFDATNFTILLSADASVKCAKFS